MRTRTWVIGTLVVLAVAAGVAVPLLKKQQDHPPGAGIGGADAPTSARGGPARADNAPVSVSTVAALQRDQAVTLDATGTVTPLNQVDLHPQLSGLVTRVHVREGQFVQRGELLFTLDDRNDQASQAKARAQLAKDQAALADAQRQLARSRELVNQQFLAQSALDTVQTLVQSQRAAVAASQAALDAAQLSLGYNRVTAPSAGRVGAVNVYPGTYVQPGGTALLSITQLDPIAVSFSVPQRYLADVLQGLKAGGTAVQAELPGGAGQTLRGKLQFVDSAVDAASGTLRVKAVFANPAHALWPGAYATVHLTMSTLAGAIVVPQAAIIRSQEGSSVYIVGPDDKAAARKVTVVYAAGEDAAVSGLVAGDAVILEGRRNVRDGVRVVVRGAAAAAPVARASAAAATP